MNSEHAMINAIVEPSFASFACRCGYVASETKPFGSDKVVMPTARRRFAQHMDENRDPDKLKEIRI